MQFDSINDFLQMGGYAFYVWLSYGITFGALAILMFVSVRKKHSVLREIAKQANREQRLKENRGTKS